MKQYPLIEDKKAYSNLVPMVLAVVITFALLFIGNYVNGTMYDELADASDNTDAITTMSNISQNWDTGIDIVQVVVIITILAGAIGAIFMFTRYGR